jgi:hypothetical protein
MQQRGSIMTDTFDALYGNKGIDTPYERETLTYHPDFKYNKNDIATILRPEVKQSIERSRTFTISHNLSEYDELIVEINQMLQDLEVRNSKELMSTLKEQLAQHQLKEIIKFAQEQSGYNQTGDFELYTLLCQMKDSLAVRRDFIDNKFRTQLTNETDLEQIQIAENQSIDQWEQLEAKVLDGYKTLVNYNEDDHVHPIDDDSLFPNKQEMNYEVIENLEKQKRNRELLHTSLADTSYVHRNRYFLFLEIVEKAKILVYQSNSLIDDNLKEFIMSLRDMPNLTAPKAHLILQFRKLKEKHDGLKGRMLTIDDEKETFASEKQYMYQQLQTKTVEPIKGWMYQQTENSSKALDKFSEYMVGSMKDSGKTYEQTLADMLNFYKSESDFYGQQISFLKNKEEIRKFYRILEDLEEVNPIQIDWVEEYLKANGYSV